MSRVRSLALAFNYLILNYLRLAYLRLAYLRLIYTQFRRHFLTAILLFLVLGCIITAGIGLGLGLGLLRLMSQNTTTVMRLYIATPRVRN